VEVGARLLTQEIGLMAAPGIESPSPASEPVAAFIVAFAGVLFFLFGAHLGALSAFAHTFQLSHAGSAVFSPLAAEHLVNGSARVLELGVRIAAPFMAMNFLTTLAFSVLGRAVPRMQVFVLSFPLRIALGMILLAGSGVLVARYLRPEFENLPLRLLELVAG
jgi:flagellar biosynthesis protein FliR